mmetsp:Transcript_42793/g.133576  ORF Transcript_42793/g.133576 Transcript_42793/m.133576 type:complete len:233 (-) Transcript_42793:1014-1712(-)
MVLMSSSESPRCPFTSMMRSPWRKPNRGLWRFHCLTGPSLIRVISSVCESCRRTSRPSSVPSFSMHTSNSCARERGGPSEALPVASASASAGVKSGTPSSCGVQPCSTTSSSSFSSSVASKISGMVLLSHMAQRRSATRFHRGPGKRRRTIGKGTFSAASLASLASRSSAATMRAETDMAPRPCRRMSAGRRHVGQRVASPMTTAHLSRQEAWNLCPHLGKGRTGSPVWMSS